MFLFADILTTWLDVLRMGNQNKHCHDIQIHESLRFVEVFFQQFTAINLLLAFLQGVWRVTPCWTLSWTWPRLIGSPFNDRCTSWKKCKKYIRKKADEILFENSDMFMVHGGDCHDAWQDGWRLDRGVCAQWEGQGLFDVYIFHTTLWWHKTFGSLVMQMFDLWVMVHVNQSSPEPLEWWLT